MTPHGPPSLFLDSCVFPKTMRKGYGKTEIDQLLVAIDRELKHPVSVIIIGGSAVIIAYNGEFYTHDIDTFSQIIPLEQAYRIAKKKTHLDIPFTYASVAEAPYHLGAVLLERHCKMSQYH